MKCYKLYKYLYSLNILTIYIECTLEITQKESEIIAPTAVSIYNYNYDVSNYIVSCNLYV